MNHAILALNLLAFVSGFSAFACVFMLYRQRPARIALLTQYSILGLIFIVSCNGLDFYLRAFAGLNDPRIQFVTMNLLTLAIIADLALLFRIIEELTGQRFSLPAWALYWAQSFFVYLACLVFPLFCDPSGIKPFIGYKISALDVALLLFVAGGILLFRFRRMIRENRRYAFFLAAFGVVWMVGDIGNELSWWSVLFGLPRMAMSPFFLILLSACVVSWSVKHLAYGTPALDDDKKGASFHGESPVGAMSPDSRWELSEREKDVFSLLICGLENADISERLFISPHTVKNHVSNIYRKSGAKNRLDLIRMLKMTGMEPSIGK